MNYKETVEYLFNSTPVFEHVGATAYKDGLDNSHALDDHFGHPHTRYQTIHVAGTNGKGSSSHTLASILQADGHRVGLYTSPHLVDFRERIRVNGVMMPEEYVVDFVREERSFFEPLHPSFFELTTALAFKYLPSRKWTSRSSRWAWADASTARTSSRPSSRSSRISPWTTRSFSATRSPR